MHTFQELDARLNAWRLERNLTDPNAQYLRFVEEVGELVTAVRKDNKADMADEFGDVIVTLFLQNQIIRRSGDELLWQWLKDKSGMQTPDFTENFAEALSNLMYGEALTVTLGSLCEQSVAIDIVEIGLYLKLDPLTCLNAAYQKIANREGQTIPGKGFVKAADL